MIINDKPYGLQVFDIIHDKMYGTLGFKPAFVEHMTGCKMVYLNPLST